MTPAITTQRQPWEAALDSPWRRPGSLKELADWSDTYQDFGLNTRDFLHAVHFARRDGRALEPFFTEEPTSLTGRFPEGAICDAFLAALADYFCRQARVLTPQWAEAASRVLEIPWFSPPEQAFRATLLRDTPAPFKEIGRASCRERV